MSILNDTLKSLDERNQSDDFCLSPTVQLPKQRPTLRIALGVIVVVALAAAYFLVSDKTNESDAILPVANEGEQTSLTLANDAPKGSELPSSKQTNQPAVDSALNSDSAMEGLRTSPLPPEDLALRANAVSVAEQAFEEAETQSDEAQPPLTAQVAPSPVEQDDAGDTFVEASNSASSVPPQATNSEPVQEVIAPVEGIVIREPSSAVRPKTPAEQSDIHYQAGMKSYEFGMYDDAQKNFLLALTADAENEQARKQLAALYYGQGNSMRALSVLSDGVLAAPTNLEWRELMAKILVGENRFEEVLNIMPDTFDTQALNERRSDYLILKGTSAQAVNQPRQAVSAFSAMTQLDPNNGKWWLALGINQDALEQAQQAAIAYERALSLGGISSASAQYATARLQALQEQR